MNATVSIFASMALMSKPVFDEASRPLRLSGGLFRIQLGRRYDLKSLGLPSAQVVVNLTR